MQQDPMFKLEHGAADVAVARKQQPRLAQLFEQKRAFEDDYGLNSTLRAKFRVCAWPGLTRPGRASPVYPRTRRPFLGNARS